MKTTCSTKCYSLHDNETLHPGIDPSPAASSTVGCRRLLLSRTVHMSNLSDFIYLFATHYKTTICRKTPERQGFVFASSLSFGGQFVARLRRTRVFLALQSEIIPIDHRPKLSHNDRSDDAPKKRGEKNHSTITKRSTRGWNVTGSRVISLFPWPFIALQTA